MARWTVTPGTEMHDNFKASIDYGEKDGDARYQIYQDVDGIIDEVKKDREMLAIPGKKQLGWRKAFTIPDIVAIEIYEKYMLDVHEPEFFHDRSKMKRLKYIVQTEYPHLVVST